MFFLLRVLRGLDTSPESVKIGASAISFIRSSKDSSVSESNNSLISFSHTDSIIQ